MIILEKNFEDIASVKETLSKIPEIGRYMNKYICSLYTDKPNPTDDFFNSYDEFVEWALDLTIKNIPSPFSISYPSCFGVNVGSNFFTLRFPGNYGIGIKVDCNKNTIKYEANFIFYGNDRFITETKEYKTMLANGWTIKPNKHK